MSSSRTVKITDREWILLHGWETATAEDRGAANKSELRAVREAMRSGEIWAEHLLTAPETEPEGYNTIRRIRELRRDYALNLPAAKNLEAAEQKFWPRGAFTPEQIEGRSRLLTMLDEIDEVIDFLLTERWPNDPGWLRLQRRTHALHDRIRQGGIS